MVARIIGICLAIYGIADLFQGEWAFGGFMTIFGLVMAFGEGGSADTQLFDDGITLWTSDSDSSDSSGGGDGGD